MKVRIAQMTLVSDIAMLLVSKYGVAEKADSRHLNAIIRAADIIVAEFGRDDIQAKAGDGLAAWLASDLGSSSLFMARTLSPLTVLGKLCQSFATTWSPWLRLIQYGLPMLAGGTKWRIYTG